MFANKGLKARQSCSFTSMQKDMQQEMARKERGSADVIYFVHVAFVQGYGNQTKNLFPALRKGNLLNSMTV